ncbi:hypothetical protein SAMN02799627_04719 [Methylobacterium sp. 13MFTsu3.1M2]|nr:hypothetical protein SAMN02799627_04719 [Methylobacterium sp. 13MFTsu3.1M2]
MLAGMSTDLPLPQKTAVLVVNWSFDDSGTTSPYDFAVVGSADKGLMNFREIPAARAWEFQDWLIAWDCDNGYRYDDWMYREHPEYFAYNIDHRMLMDLQINWFEPQ